MESLIRKHIDEYQSKITDCDRKLKAIEAEKISLRERVPGGSEIGVAWHMNELSSIYKDEAGIKIQRQCYVQAMHDFDSLLDLV